jgi:hypothetical protein
MYDVIDLQMKMILIEMNKLYVMFCMPIMVLATGEIIYRWSNTRAHALYNDYSELLNSLRDKRTLN